MLCKWLFNKISLDASHAAVDGCRAVQSMTDQLTAFVSSTLLEDLTRLHLLPHKPSSVQIDAAVTILEAFTAGRLSAKDTGRRSR